LRRGEKRIGSGDCGMESENQDKENVSLENRNANEKREIQVKRIRERHFGGGIDSEYVISI
jgi:hypothetical protein